MTITINYTKCYATENKLITVRVRDKYVCFNHFWFTIGKIKINFKIFEDSTYNQVFFHENEVIMMKHYEFAEFDFYKVDERFYITKKLKNWHVYETILRDLYEQQV